VTPRGLVPLTIAGRRRPVTGGPFDALPPGAIGLCLERAAARAGEAALVVPVPDFGVPEDPAAFRAALEHFLALLAAAPEAPAHVGCRAGLGRTGMALACLAVLTGDADGDPVDWLRARYDPRAVETPAQEAFVRGFG
jgi:protein-tyrosine phosphatase